MRLCVILTFSLLAQLTSLHALGGEPPRRGSFEHTQRVLEAEERAAQFAKDLKLVGQKGRAALDALLGMGFECGFRTVDVREGTSSFLFCTKRVSEVKDCARIDLYIFPAWIDVTRPFDKLLPELETVTVSAIETACLVQLRDD